MLTWHNNWRGQGRDWSHCVLPDGRIITLLIEREWKPGKVSMALRDPTGIYIYNMYPDGTAGTEHLTGEKCWDSLDAAKQGAEEWAAVQYPLVALAAVGAP